MGKEIERKFLLVDNSWRGQVQRSRRMRQGYLSSGEQNINLKFIKDSDFVTRVAADCGELLVAGAAALEAGKAACQKVLEIEL